MNKWKEESLRKYDAKVTDTSLPAQRVWVTITRFGKTATSVPAVIVADRDCKLPLDGGFEDVVITGNDDGAEYTQTPGGRTLFVSKNDFRRRYDEMTYEDRWNDGTK